MSPQRVGKNIARSVSFTLLVSFFMVRIVVAQGKCIREKIITQIAVAVVQPFAMRISRNAESEEKSQREVPERYPIKIIGKKISFAGSASKIVPSRPKRVPMGFKKSVQHLNIEVPPIFIFEKHQITRPAGAATATARPSTKSVRSNTERTITLPNWGTR